MTSPTLHNLVSLFHLKRLTYAQFHLLILAVWTSCLLPISAKQKANVDYHKGLEFLAQNQKTEALRSFQKAVAQDPTLAKAQFSIGMLLKEQEQWLQAQSALESAIEFSPNYVASYCALAELQMDVFSQVSAVNHLMYFHIHS